MREPVGLDRPHVPPVRDLLIGLYARNGILHEVVRIRTGVGDEFRHDRTAEVVVGAAPGVFHQRVHQRVTGEEVVAHRGQGLGGIARHWRRRQRLLFEADEPAVWIGDHHPKPTGPLDRYRQGGHRDIGALGLMERQHLPDVHAIDVIGAEDGHQVRREVQQQVEVLVDGVGSALVPRLAPPHLRRHDDHEVIRQPTQPPGVAQVLDQ